MLTNIELVAGTTTITIPVLDYAFGSPYVLKAVTGLGPPDIDVFVLDKVSSGSIYSGRRVPKREIVTRIGLNPDYSTSMDPVGVLRANLYSLLSPSLDSDLVTINLIDSVKATVTTNAIVEKFEVPSSNQEVEVQITFICPDPFFKTVAPISLTPGLATINVTYDGTENVGFTAKIDVGANASWVKLVNSATSKEMTFTDTWNTSDDIFLDTRVGSRSVTRVRSAVTTNRFHTLGFDPEWLGLTKGVNTITASASAGTPTIGQFSYQPIFWGV